MQAHLDERAEPPTAGEAAVFDDTLLEHVNAFIHLLQSPLSLANALNAAGAEALGACGTILDERVGSADDSTPR